MEEKNANIDTVSQDDEEVELVDPATLIPDLFAATSQNNTEQVLRYLEMGVPPSYYDSKSGLTALHLASMKGNVVVVKRLLECGASQPYHNCVTKLKKASSPKAKKLRQMDSKLTSISEAVEGEDGPLDETKETAEAEKDVDGDLDAEESLGIDLNAITSDTTIDYTKNTPLLWATHSGHLRVVWLLLIDGYSPSDTDRMMNNALHLAAAYGDVKILQALISDGGNANAVNFYKNKPIDMAKNKAVRDLLAVAMEAGASMTDEDRRVKHEQNIRQYQKMTRSVEDAIAEANAVKNNSPRGTITVTSKRVNRILLDAIELGKEYSLDEDLILQAEDLLKKIEVSQELAEDIIALQSLAPIKEQSIYIEYVYKLEKSIEKAVEVKTDDYQIQYGMELIAKSQAEYWLNVLLERLKDVTTANDTNEHDMNKLRKALEKAEALHGHEELVENGRRFLGRLDAELGLFRALRAIPVFKPMIENPPEGYWTERDVGHIEENEGFPLPPPETGEYLWIQSEALSTFSSAVARLKEIYNSPDAVNANPKIVADAKERLTKAEKELKQLENKEEADRTSAIEAAKKAAKKLKKKKKEKA
mmetsp:Transcript_10716/g.11558  ORF Transcript_10716/g.11558 Transcript_10716/m.11558 type:complete len:590 (+) Transcript_10716:31-1800(+)